MLAAIFQVDTLVTCYVLCVLISHLCVVVWGCPVLIFVREPVDACNQSMRARQPFVSMADWSYSSAIYLRPIIPC